MFGIKFGDAQSSAPEGEYVTARLNARVQPLDRGDYFEDPLTEVLEKSDLGAVTGGGTQLADEPAGIEFCDVEICLNAADETSLATVISALEAQGAPKGSRLIVEASGEERPFGVHEGIGVFLNGHSLPDEVYETSDVNHVIEKFDELLGEAGAFRGYWEGSKETALYCYGPSFEAMKAALAPFLEEYPLCQGARIEQIA